MHFGDRLYIDGVPLFCAAALMPRVVVEVCVVTWGPPVVLNCWWLSLWWALKLIRKYYTTPLCTSEDAHERRVPL
jgi:hypothetical protein